jgi:hypothetical protein
MGLWVKKSYKTIRQSNTCRGYQGTGEAQSGTTGSGRSNVLVVKCNENEQNKPVPAISGETMVYWREAAGDAG